MTPAGARAIGRFQIEAEAASGAAGTVYQAIDRATGERVAVKVLRGLCVADAARFAREARLLAQIRHPGVVRYVDHGTTDEGAAYLVMEWLEGEDLRRRVSRAGLSIRESVALGLRVAEALAAVHAHGVVHRDIKPANLFLPGGSIAEAKIIDFGLVHAEWTSVEVTRTGMVVGTPTYMSPEQARGQRIVDARADLFSLGCVLYKCLTGRAPFEGTSVLAVLTKVLLEEATPLRAVRREVPAALDDLVMRLIRKDPEQRPADAAAVAQELQALVALRDLGEAAVPAPSSAVFSGLTTSEQRVVSVLIIGAPSAAPPSGEVTLLQATRSSTPLARPSARSSRRTADSSTRCSTARAWSRCRRRGWPWSRWSARRAARWPCARSCRTRPWRSAPAAARSRCLTGGAPSGKTRAPPRTPVGAPSSGPWRCWRRPPAPTGERPRSPSTISPPRSSARASRWSRGPTGGSASRASGRATARRAPSSVGPRPWWAATGSWGRSAACSPPASRSARRARCW